MALLARPGDLAPADRRHHIAACQQRVEALVDPEPYVVEVGIGHRPRRTREQVQEPGEVVQQLLAVAAVVRVLVVLEERTVGVEALARALGRRARVVEGEDAVGARTLDVRKSVTHPDEVVAAVAEHRVHGDDGGDPHPVGAGRDLPVGPPEVRVGGVAADGLVDPAEPLRTERVVQQHGRVVERERGADLPVPVVVEPGVPGPVPVREHPVDARQEQVAQRGVAVLDGAGDGPRGRDRGEPLERRRDVVGERGAGQVGEEPVGTGRVQALRGRRRGLADPRHGRGDLRVREVEAGAAGEQGVPPGTQGGGVVDRVRGVRGACREREGQGGGRAERCRTGEHGAAGGAPGGAWVHGAALTEGVGGRRPRRAPHGRKGWGGARRRCRTRAASAPGGPDRAGRRRSRRRCRRPGRSARPR